MSQAHHSPDTPRPDAAPGPPQPTTQPTSTQPIPSQPIPPGTYGTRPRTRTSSIDREILTLALPALGALAAEPLFVLVDSAVVGRLGTAELAGLALASNLLVTVVGLCVFLAYATTAVVARLVGAGREHDALQAGIDGLWLALLIGAGLAVVAWLCAPAAVTALGGSGDVATHAVSYLRASAFGLPGMLTVLAATGVLRGLKDTRTPLVVASVGAVVNAGVNIALVYGAGLGITGSGLGTALTQLGMAATLVVVVARGARSRGASLRPVPGGIWASVIAGFPLLVRTASLRLAILLTVTVATHLGEVTLAAHQIVGSLWGLAAFALDALAIAAQALVGHSLGARDVAHARTLLRRCVRWGVLAGAGIGIVLGASGWWVAPLFGTDDGVRAAAAAGLAVCGLLMPLAGWVYVLDGVLIGAGDGRYLAAVGMLTLAVYAPVAVAVGAWAPHGAAGLAWLWAAFAGVFMLARALTTGLRARGSHWMITGP